MDENHLESEYEMEDTVEIDSIKAEQWKTDPALLDSSRKQTCKLFFGDENIEHRDQKRTVLSNVNPVCGEHRIAVLSDTHSLLRPEIMEILQTCEAILHAGDFASEETAQELGKMAPHYFVMGNADKNWAEGIPEERSFELFGYHFFMIHNSKKVKEVPEGTEILVHGHTHKYEAVERDGILYLNPGSCGPRRFHQPVTMAVMTIDAEKHTYRIEKIECTTEERIEIKQPKKNKEHQIRGIRKDKNTEDTAAEIAAENDAYGQIRGIRKSRNTGNTAAEIAAENDVDGPLRGIRKSRNSGKMVAEIAAEKDMYRLIRGIMKDMDSGKTVARIAGRNRVDVDFVEQILQIYTTHPGIDVYGIMDRMDILGK